MSLGPRASIRRILILLSTIGLLGLGVIAVTSRNSPAGAHDAEEHSPPVQNTAQDGRVSPIQDIAQVQNQDRAGRLAAQPDNGLGQLPNGLDCPAMTDSITRLFSALFNRAPTGSEFLDLATRYQIAETSVEAMAEELVGSDEFVTRYGNLSDDRYITLVYRNTLRSLPTDAERQFWTNSLAAGSSRGTMMVGFTESAEFVNRTETATPLSGYLRWYPEGTHWYCGVGPRDDMSIKPLDNQVVYADFAFFNGGVEQSPVDLFTVLGSRPHIEVTSGSLPPGFTSYKWGGLFDGDGNYGTALTIDAGQSTSWIVVFYPTPIGEKRLGWQIEP